MLIRLNKNLLKSNINSDDLLIDYNLKLSPIKCSTCNDGKDNDKKLSVKMFRYNERSREDVVARTKAGQHKINLSYSLSSTSDPPADRWCSIVLVKAQFCAY